MKQSDVMLASEGNAWFTRNRRDLGKRDPVSDMIGQRGVVPKCVLEIGCSNGWRLAKLRDKYGCGIFGIEPSRQAAIEAAGRAVPITCATAEALPFKPATFDLVIYGFCLYMADPTDWMKIAAEGDRVLLDGGVLVIHDFNASSYVFAQRYKHHDGMLAYHMDFSKLWLANPLYALVARHFPNDDEMITVLKKRPADSIEVWT